MKPTKATYLGKLNEYNSNPFINGKTNVGFQDLSQSKRGGRVRAFLMTDHNEEYFQYLQTLNQPIPFNLFHSSEYDQQIFSFIIDIHQKQKKYIPLSVNEIWTQSEYRRQVTPYCREYIMECSKRCFDEDVQILIAWFFDLDIGIRTRIKEYNAMLETKMKTTSISVPFRFSFHRKMVLKPIQTRKKRKRLVQEQEISPPFMNMNKESSIVIQEAVDEIKQNYQEEHGKEINDYESIYAEFDVALFNECVEQLQSLKQSHLDEKENSFHFDHDYNHDMDAIDFYLQYKDYF